MLITHDLAVVSQMVDKINVMYCGKLVETGKTEDIIYHNAHPYTEGLLNSIPKLYEDRDRLDYIPGMVPNMFELPEAVILHQDANTARRSAAMKSRRCRKWDRAIWLHVTSHC